MNIGNLWGKSQQNFVLFICLEIEGQILTFKGSFDLDNL